MDIFQKSITPDKPRVLAEEQIYVYVPMATSTNAGIASYNKDQFDVIGSEVSLKWPAESFTQGPIETPSIVKVLDNEFEYTGNLVDLISGNSKISSDKLEVQLKRILRDAYERPELVMLDPNYFVRTIVEKDGKQYYKYNTTAVHYNISQTLSEDEQAQARQNISASSISDNEATNQRIDALLQTGVYSINGKTGNVILKNSDLENDTNYATEQYVQENGGKIDKIVLNDNEQEIINKIVTLTIDKTTVGLSNVDNTSDANKPVSIAQANAINQVQSNLDEHLSNYENPHNVTKTQIGLSNVDNTSDKNKPISDAAKQALDTKMNKSGGIFTGNVGVQGNLSVSGTTITKDTETLKVQDNVIVTNANKIELLDLSGLAINKNDTQTYGIMYDAVDDSIKLGLGSIGSDDKFTFNEGEGSPVATRSDSSLLTDNHLLKWDATNNKLVDSGYSAEDKLDKISTSSTHQRAYIVDTDGSQNSIAVSITSTAPEESLIKRDKWGCAEVDTPGYSDIGKRIVNQEYVKTHFYTRADDLKPQYIYTDTIYNWHHDQTDKTEDAHSKIDFTPYSTEILTTTKDDESARIKLGADPRTTPTVNESQAHVDISIGKPNDYSTGITLSNNYQEIFGDGISLYTYQNGLTDARILTLSANGLFISEGLEINTETQTAQLKNKKEISPNTIRYDIEQTLTDEQKAQARANIGASSISDNDAINNRIDAYELQVDANTAARHVHNNKEILDGITASYTTEEKAKLNGIASGAEVNVQADWAQTDSSSKDYIKNKPLIPEGIKLYSSTGENTDGAMTQKAVTDEFKNNVSILFAESERQKSKNLLDKNLLKTGCYLFLTGGYDNNTSYMTFEPISVTPNSTITISCNGFEFNNDCGFVFFNNGVYVGYLSNGATVATVPANANQVIYNFYKVDITKDDLQYAQLEYGSVATDYQPYRGQITHNGDAPVVFAEAERQKSKNLFNATHSEETSYSMTYSADTSKLYISGTYEDGARCRFGTWSLKKGTYTLCIKFVSGSMTRFSAIKFFLYKGNSWTQYASCPDISNSNTQVYVTFTLDEDVSDATLMLYQNLNNNTMTDCVFEYQIVAGSVPDFDFQPYHGAIVHEKELDDYVTINTEQTISSKKTYTQGLIVSGRPYNSGDDEGIVITKASNNYAGLCLGSPTGARSVHYLMPDNGAIWRWSNGSSSYDISHPQKAGTIALTSDIPTFTLNDTTLEITL